MTCVNDRCVNDLPQGRGAGPRKRSQVRASEAALESRMWIRDRTEWERNMADPDWRMEWDIPETPCDGRGFEQGDPPVEEGGGLTVEYGGRDYRTHWPTHKGGRWTWRPEGGKYVVMALCKRC